MKKVQRLSDFVEEYGSLRFVFSHYTDGDFVFDEFEPENNDRKITCVCRDWGFENMPLIAGQVYCLFELDLFFIRVKVDEGVQLYVA